MNDKINEVREANDIVEVISSYIPLVKKGKNYFGVCPFHDDTNPSMSVSKEKQIYKCFSCGASGNVFNFVMDYEHVDFKEALNILAKRSGISLGNIHVSSEHKNEKYYKMYDLALKLYQNNLNSKLGVQAKEYLYDRKINDDMIKHFKIGLASNERDTLSKVLINKDYSLKEMEIYGLGNGKNDLFINRIMFPLFDVSGDVVGFSGRIYNSKSDSKYINTKETPIFVKGKLLYNYHVAKDYARKKGSIILVEGFMDVIRLYSVGINNVVALMGTALTKDQMDLLKRTSLNICLCFDGDNAGKIATYNNGGMLEKKGFNVSVISLKDNLDPDEFIIKYGKDDYVSLYENAITFSDYKLMYLREGKDLTNVVDQSEYINDVLSELKDENDEVKIELFLNKISLEFNIDVSILRKKLQNLKKCSKIETFEKEAKPVVKKKLDKYDKASLVILGYMLNSYDATKKYEKKLNYLPSLNARCLANEIIYYYKMNGSLVLADFLTTLNDKSELRELCSLVFKYEIDDPNLEYFDDYIKVIEDYSVKEEISKLKSQLKDEVDPVKQAKIAEKIRLAKMGVESNG